MIKERRGDKREKNRWQKRGDWGLTKRKKGVTRDEG
jgi:hypothetical protein